MTDEQYYNDYDEGGTYISFPEDPSCSPDNDEFSGSHYSGGGGGGGDAEGCGCLIVLIGALWALLHYVFHVF